MECTCGWSGTEWMIHWRDIDAAWRAERRAALRARLLASEGITEP